MKVLKKRKLKKLIQLIKKNQDFINRLVVSEDFLDQIKEFPQLVEIESIEDKETESEQWFLFGVPSVVSSFVLRGCVLEMEGDEFVVIKGI